MSIYDNLADYGGLINLESRYISFLISNSEIYNTGSITQAGIVNLVDASKLRIVDSTIYDFSSPDASFLYSTSQNVEIFIENSDITCNRTLDITDIEEYLNLEIPDSQFTTAAQISNAKNISVS